MGFPSCKKNIKGWYYWNEEGVVELTLLFLVRFSECIGNKFITNQQIFIHNKS